MPSHLRLQSNFEPFSAETTRSYFPTSPQAPPAKKQKMSLSQTYYIAASARTKLTHEAQKSDHDLRLLVGHANLLDSLMLELAEAEREQEAWFNKTVNKAARSERHIQWADTIDEEVMEDDEEDDDEISDSESDSDYDEDAEDFNMIPPLRRIPSPPVRVTTTELEDEDDEEDDEDDEEEYYEDEEFDEEHALVRSPSQQQPPELVHEEDSDSDDDATPTTPPQPTLDYPSPKDRQAMATEAFYERKEAPISTPDQAAFLPEGYFLEQRNAPLITSY